MGKVRFILRSSIQLFPTSTSWQVYLNWVLELHKSYIQMSKKRDYSIIEVYVYPRLVRLSRQPAHVKVGVQDAGKY